jgi:hypothetical protein
LLKEVCLVLSVESETMAFLGKIYARSKEQAQGPSGYSRSEATRARLTARRDDEFKQAD